MDADSLRAQVRAHFRQHGARYALDPETVRADYVLNWGGFVNASYHVRDDERRYHLKLATIPEYLDGLVQWRNIAPLLEAYRAPRIVDWVELEGAAGLLFAHVEGARPALGDALLDELLPHLQRLHNDATLAAALDDSEPITARDVYRSSFHERFLEDLRGIRATPPPFVSPSLLRLMEAEVVALAEAVHTSSAFAERLTGPVHGDLWLNNILWNAPGEWWLLDWDDVRIGDPAADIAALVGPTADDLTPLKRLDRVEGMLAPGARERLPLLGRATLLDWVIDPLSDWIDASTAPGVEGVVRSEKERVHRAALALYARLYR